MLTNSVQSNKKELSDIKLKKYVYTLVIPLFILVLLKSLWINDDAAITFRTILNTLNNFGLTFNISERVQAYTHPLWFMLLLLSTKISGNVFISTFFVSAIVSILNFLILIRKASKKKTILAISFILILSKSFIDYSSSGLENPLSHLFIILILFNFLEENNRKLLINFILCSCIFLTRPDLLLLVTPITLALISENKTNKIKTLKSFIIGSTPVLIWTLFSIFYYGFPFPNTAYAKLGTGLTLIDKIPQGALYFLDSLKNDPITLIVITISIYLGLISKKTRPIAIGIALYLAYICYIGGDFMSGRFLSTPFIAAAIILMIEINKTESIKKSTMVIIIISIGLLNIKNTILTPSKFEKNGQFFLTSGIADERAYYFNDYGLINYDTKKYSIPEWVIKDSKIKPVTACGGLGFKSLHAGPATHFIDTCALTDPLLARIPAEEDQKWRIGHFHRQIPTDYIKSIEENKNLLKDQDIFEYYDLIRSVTRDELFSTERIKKIIQINTLKPPKNSTLKYKITPIAKDSLNIIKRIEDVDDTTFNETLEIQLKDTQLISGLSLTLSSDAVYEVFLVMDAQETSIAKLEADKSQFAFKTFDINLDNAIVLTKRIIIKTSNNNSVLKNIKMHRLSF